MNNKPVAWMWSEDGCNMGVCLDQDKQIGKQEFQDYSIPLYIHPVKEQDCYGDGNVYRGVRSKDSEIQTIHFNPVKELTDEEILKLEEIEFENYCVDKESRGRKTATITDPEWAIWFAKAILRKAQK